MLSSIFHHYIQRTKTICLYGIGSMKVSSKLIFPQATTVVLIHCKRSGVEQFLTPHHFPNVKHIHYLSAHPGIVDIYRRFDSSVSWSFPNRDYIFYQCMLEAGKGEINPRLIQKYVCNVRNEPTSMKVDLLLPELGEYRGTSYQIQLSHYLRSPYHPVQHNYSRIDTLFANLSSTDDSEYDHVAPSSIQSYLYERISKDFFEGIMRDCKQEEDALKIKL